MLNWDDIVEQYGPLVWRTAYRLVGCEADASDCYQEAFAAALSVSRRESVRNWPALLQKPATVHSLDQLRRRFRNGARQGLPVDLNLVPSAIAEPSQIAEEHELIEWLRIALSELPESQAQAFSFVCIGELSYQEAATHMNVEPNHVAVLLHRARSRLRELLMRTKQAEANY
jgi:RNA polymerase sigma factor (sigma-70 family)